MNGKNILTIVLLLFVTAAVVTAVIRQSGEEPAGQVASTQIAADQIATEPTPENGLVATYFHGDVPAPPVATSKNTLRRQSKKDSLKSWERGTFSGER